MNPKELQQPPVKPAVSRPDHSLVRFLTVVLPQVSRELQHWQRYTSRAEWPLLRQASASLNRKRFHAQGGSFYALYNFNPLYEKTLVKLIVALQTISDYLDNLCDRSGVYSEAAFRYLHRAVLEALSSGPASTVDYYRFYPSRHDGGYLKALVAECRSCTGTLPGYAAMEPEILQLASRYNDLQVYKHLHPNMRSSRVKRWFREKAAPDTPALHWWEYAAACGSTLGLFALFGLATSSRAGPQEARQLVRAYFPWVCGLHILLDYWIDQDEDLRGGDLNFVACYPSPAQAVERLTLFLGKALQEVSALPHASFHRTVVQGLLAVYLSDPKVRAQELQVSAAALLRAGGSGAGYFYHLCLLLRRFKVL